MAIIISLVYILMACLIAFNIHRGAKRTKARLTYITWFGAPRFTLRDSKGRFTCNHAGLWDLAIKGV